MTPARRRSSRLRANNGTPYKVNKHFKSAHVIASFANV
jgi:hypothetical protein